MNDFERGFLEELEKIAYGAPSAPAPPGLGKQKSELMQVKPVATQKSIATAIRNPLSLVTNIKPPEQTFYSGK
jgi:hypothetical protein